MSVVGRNARTALEEDSGALPGSPEVFRIWWRTLTPGMQFAVEIQEVSEVMDAPAEPLEMVCRELEGGP